MPIGLVSQTCVVHNYLAEIKSQQDILKAPVRPPITCPSHAYTIAMTSTKLCMWFGLVPGMCTNILFFCPAPRRWVGAISKCHKSQFGHFRTPESNSDSSYPPIMGSVSSMVGFFICPTPREWMGAISKFHKSQFGHFWTLDSNSDVDLSPIYGDSEFNGDMTLKVKSQGHVRNWGQTLQNT